MGLKETICKKKIHIWDEWHTCVHRRWLPKEQVQETRKCRLCGIMQWRYRESKNFISELPIKYLEEKDNYR